MFTETPENYWWMAGVHITTALVIGLILDFFFSHWCPIGAAYMIFVQFFGIAIVIYMADRFMSGYGIRVADSMFFISVMLLSQIHLMDQLRAFRKTYIKDTAAPKKEKTGNELFVRKRKEKEK